MTARKWLDRLHEDTFAGFAGSTVREINTDRLDLDEALELLREAHAEVARIYIEGAVGWALADPELTARLRAAEGEIERLAGAPGGPLRCDWTAAVGALLRLWREIVERYRRHRAAA